MLDLESAGVKCVRCKFSCQLNKVDVWAICEGQPTFTMGTSWDVDPWAEVKPSALEQNDRRICANLLRMVGTAKFDCIPTETGV